MERKCFSSNDSRKNLSLTSCLQLKQDEAYLSINFSDLLVFLALGSVQLNFYRKYSKVRKISYIFLLVWKIWKQLKTSDRVLQVPLFSILKLTNTYLIDFYHVLKYFFLKELSDEN